MSCIDEETVDAMSGRACPCVATDGAVRAIARREFVTGAAAALAALALAACGNTGDFTTSPGTVASTSLELSNFPALANVGGVATTSVSGTPIAIVRTSASTFSAFSRICPHQGTTINVLANEFQCPRHESDVQSVGTMDWRSAHVELVSYPVAYDATSAMLTIGG